MRYIVGDVREVLGRLPDRSIDLALTSSPFFALRDYLDAGDPSKLYEIGAEPTPGMFIDNLLDVVEAVAPKLTEKGSIVWELGDSFGGSGGAGGDYSKGGLREGQQKFVGTARRKRSKPVSLSDNPSMDARPPSRLRTRRRLPGFPMDKSLVGIPELFRLSLIYGVNMLPTPCRRCAATGISADGPMGATQCPECAGAGERHRTTPPWRARNVVRWHRPNPTVGDLGDKFRTATSDMVVLCKSDRRYFDLDSVRTPLTEPGRVHRKLKDPGRADGYGRAATGIKQNAVGAPPHDYWVEGEDDEISALEAQLRAYELVLADLDVELEDDSDATDLFDVATQPYKGSHYAVWPPRLLEKPVKTMCPERVCMVCGEPSVRLTRRTRVRTSDGEVEPPRVPPTRLDGEGTTGIGQRHAVEVQIEDLGWSECGCGDGCRATTWRKETFETPILDDDGNETGRMAKRSKLVVDDPGGCTDPTHWRRGVVLDPFGGSGTTGIVAQGLGRDAVLIDLDARNVSLAEQRIGPLFLEVLKVDDLPDLDAACPDCGSAVSVVNVVQPALLESDPDRYTVRSCTVCSWGDRRLSVP